MLPLEKKIADKQREYCKTYVKYKELSWLKNPFKKFKLLCKLPGIQDEIDELESFWSRG